MARKKSLLPHRRLVILIALGLVATSSVQAAFVVPTRSALHRRRRSCIAAAASGKGFGGEGGSSPKKSYDSQALQPRKDLIDTDAAMREFFDGTALEWKPLFQSLTQTDIPVMAPDDDSEVEPNTANRPWKALEGIPTVDSHRAILANFLDAVQASLVDIPVDERTKEDEFDLQFLEEGRRMLVCGRFHVVPYPSDQDRLEHFDAVFSTCWNEVYYLHQTNEIDTGSVIIVPDCQDLDDLRRFVDVNLQRPLQWMGLDDIFEVASLQRGSPAIRLIHKLSDMPTDLPEEAQTMGDKDNTEDGASGDS